MQVAFVIISGSNGISSTEQDPAGVSALLEQLRSSQAWSELNSTASSNENAPPQPSPEKQEQKEESGSSVADLLSRLRDPSVDSNRARENASNVSGGSVPTARPRDSTNARNFTFQQALPRLAQLSENPSFVSRIEKVRPA